MARHTIKHILRYSCNHYLGHALHSFASQQILGNLDILLCDSWLDPGPQILSLPHPLPSSADSHRLFQVFPAQQLENQVKQFSW